MTSPTSDPFLQAAIEEAQQGLAEGGIPIGSMLVIDDEIVGRGHNRRVQQGSAILHAEMDAIENAGRLKAADYRRAILYSTLSHATCVRERHCSTVFPRLSSVRIGRFKGQRIICDQETLS